MTTQLAPLTVQHFTDNNGNLLAGGQLYTYAAGTSTPLATYTDSTGGTANANPVVMNARGEANVWTTGGLSYKFVLEDASGNLIWMVDNITDGSLNSALAAALASTSNLAQGVALVGGAARFVASIAALRTLPNTGSPEVFVTGYYAQGDGGGGAYWYDSTDTTSADNGSTIIVASDGGRWKLTPPYSLNTRQLGAKGDGTTDDSTALNAAFSLGEIGYVIQAGSYLFATGIVQDNSPSSPAFPGVGALSARNDVRGESMSNSILNFSGTGYAINLTGSTTSGAGQGIHALDNYRNFTLQCAAQNQSNSGLGLTNKAWWKVEDVIFSGLSVAMLITACFTATVRNCYFSNNTYGIDFAANALGAPNLITVEGCVFQSHSYAGILGTALGTNISFRNCNFESCGTQGNGSTGAVISNANAAAGFVGPVIFENCYFENSAGGADIQVTNTSATLTLTVIVRGCLFQRISNTNYTTSNIGIASAGGPVIVLMEGNSFVSTGTYVPSSARPFWSGPANCIFRDLGGNIYSETTSLPSASNLAVSYPIASATFVGTSGAASVANNCTISRTGVGLYTVTFIIPPAVATYTPVVTMDRGGNGAMGYSVTAQTPTSFSFSCTNSAATAVDPGNVWVAVMQ